MGNAACCGRRSNRVVDISIVNARTTTTAATGTSISSLQTHIQQTDFEQQFCEGKSQLQTPPPQKFNFGQQCYNGQSRPTTAVQITASHDNKQTLAADGYHINDFEMVITMAKQLEELLEDKFSASGEGLGQKIGSVHRKLPKDVVRKANKMNKKRNALVHNTSWKGLNSKQRLAFIELFEYVNQRL